MMTGLTAPPIKSAKGLAGTIKVAGDKSISHRAIMLAALAQGKSEINGLLEGDDVLATAGAFQKLGVDITRTGKGCWQVSGVGLNGFREADGFLDMGNSGTAMRLMMGVLAGQNFRSFLCGDQSLNKRPMARVATPLSQMGAVFHCRADKYPPLMIEGTHDLLPLSYDMPMASAQVKSAILLAGLLAEGVTEVSEPAPTRNHTEIMLARMGAKIEGGRQEPGQMPAQITGKATIRIYGRPTLTAQKFTVPSDISSAAFPLVAALIVPKSEITLKAVGMNPTRTGILTALKLMGADIEIADQRQEAGEAVADLIIKASALKGVHLDADLAPLMIDEYPIMAVAAAFADGVSRFDGLGELRVKESDRLAAIVAGLRANGVACDMGEDWLEIEGGSGNVAGGGQVTTHHDHRIAMSFLVMGMAAQSPISVDDRSMIDTSFPDFESLMTQLGAEFTNLKTAA